MFGHRCGVGQNLSGHLDPQTFCVQRPFQAKPLSAPRVAGECAANKLVYLQDSWSVLREVRAPS